MNPRISVIIPVYNGERFVRRAIQCVLDQEYPAHEIIVINDGSKDGSQAILESYSDRIRLKAIPNGGVSNARNVATAMATGDYVAYLDVDDIWFRNKLKVIAELIRQNPEADFFASDYVLRLDYHGRRMKKHSKLIGHQDEINYNAPLKVHPLKLLLGFSFTSTPSAVVVRKAAAERIGGFDRNIRLIEDLEFYLRFALAGRFVLTDKILLYKYNHPENLSFDDLSSFEAKKAMLKNFYAANKTFIDKNGLRRDAKRRIYVVTYRAGDLYFERGQKGKAFAYYWSGLICYPSPSNVLMALSHALKKLIRILTFDLISRKKLWKK